MMLATIAPRVSLNLAPDAVGTQFFKRYDAPENGCDAGGAQEHKTNRRASCPVDGSAEFDGRKQERVEEYVGVLLNKVQELKEMIHSQTEPKSALGCRQIDKVLRLKSRLAETISCDGQINRATRYAWRKLLHSVYVSPSQAICACLAESRQCYKALTVCFAASPCAKGHRIIKFGWFRMMGKKECTGAKRTFRGTPSVGAKAPTP